MDVIIMKLERISDNQIKCTLNRNDLRERELKLSELAYGSEKAKSLFQDMVDMAKRQLGFEVDDEPLMIEAIPLSAECIILIITKVDDPEELDTRFSKFTRNPEASNTGGESDAPLGGTEDRFNSLFNLIKESIDEAKKSLTASDSEDESKSGRKASSPISPDEEIDGFGIFSFSSWKQAAAAAKCISFFKGESSFYKDPEKGRYYLVLAGSVSTTSPLFKACNLLTEYGQREKFTASFFAYIKEHYDCLIKAGAVKLLPKY